MPFGSLDGEQYRIDIYAEGVPTEVKTLEGAAEPFTTDEDNSDDFFSQVRGQTGVIRIVDESSNAELIRYDLGEDFSIETAVVVGEMYRHSGEWKFNAIGSGFQGGLAALCAQYGIDAE